MKIKILRPLHNAAGRVPHAVLFTDGEHDGFLLMLCLLNTGHTGSVCSLQGAGLPEAYTRMLKMEENSDEHQ